MLAKVSFSANVVHFQCTLYIVLIEVVFNNLFSWSFQAEKPNPAIGYVYWWFLNSDHGLGDRLRSELITRLREMQAGFNLIKQVYENKDYWMIAHLNRDQFIVLTGVLKDLLFENGRCWQLPECPVPTSDAIPLDNLNSPIILLLASE